MAPEPWREGGTVKLGTLRVAMLKNAAVATLQSDLDGWLRGATTGGASAVGTLPVVGQQQVVSTQFAYLAGEYLAVIYFTE